MTIYRHIDHPDIRYIDIDMSDYCKETVQEYRKHFAQKERRRGRVRNTTVPMLDDLRCEQEGVQGARRRDHAAVPGHAAWPR